jgi:hypothetical protein
MTERLQESVMKMLAVGLLACTLFVQPAAAAGVGQARLTDIMFTLTDLAPHDGRDVYWTIVDTGPGPFDYPSTNFSTIVRGEQESSSVHGAFAEGAVQLAVGGHSGSASHTGGVMQADIAWDAIVPGESITGSVVYGTLLLLLAPHSSLTVTGLASIAGNSTEAADYFSIGAGMSFGFDGDYVFDYVQHVGTEPFAVDTQRPVSVSWFNDSNSVTNTYYNFNVGAFMYPPPVPEPSAWALLLAGLALLAAPHAELGRRIRCRLDRVCRR